MNWSYINVVTGAWRGTETRLLFSVGCTNESFSSYPPPLCSLLTAHLHSYRNRSVVVIAWDDCLHGCQLLTAHLHSCRNRAPSLLMLHSCNWLKKSMLISLNLMKELAHLRFNSKHRKKVNTNYVFNNTTGHIPSSLTITIYTIFIIIKWLHLTGHRILTQVYTIQHQTIIGHKNTTHLFTPTLR